MTDPSSSEAEENKDSINKSKQPSPTSDDSKLEKWTEFKNARSGNKSRFSKLNPAKPPLHKNTKSGLQKLWSHAMFRWLVYQAFALSILYRVWRYSFAAERAINRDAEIPLSLWIAAFALPAIITWWRSAIRQWQHATFRWLVYQVPLLSFGLLWKHGLLSRREIPYGIGDFEFLEYSDYDAGFDYLMLKIVVFSSWSLIFTIPTLWVWRKIWKKKFRKLLAFLNKKAEEG